MWQRLFVVVAVAGVMYGFVALGCPLWQASAALPGIVATSRQVWGPAAGRGGAEAGSDGGEAVERASTGAGVRERA